MPMPVPGRIVEALRRSTVQVLSGAAQDRGSGSGIVITDGQVVTNAHVVRGKPVAVESWEGSRLPADLLKLDRLLDLALLRVPHLNVPPASLGDSDSVRPGVPVVAVGNPLGFVGAVSSGIVHSIGPAAPLGGQTAIFADLRLAPGNSGGPLADFRGQVIGINTMLINGGLAVAIPSRLVQSFLRRSAPASRLGVVVRPVRLHDRSMGMMILELTPGGAAERASLLPGDILVGSNGVRFRGVEDLEAIAEQVPGSVVHIEFNRAGLRTVRRVALLLERKPVPSAA